MLDVRLDELARDVLGDLERLGDGAALREEAGGRRFLGGGPPPRGGLGVCGGEVGGGAALFPQGMPNATNRISGPQIPPRGPPLGRDRLAGGGAESLP